MFINKWLQSFSWYSKAWRVDLSRIIMVNSFEEGAMGEYMLAMVDWQ